MVVDLQAEYPGIQGFSRTSLFAMRQFYLFSHPVLKLSHSLWDNVKTGAYPHDSWQSKGEFCDESVSI